MGALPGAVSLSDALKKTADALLLLRDQTLDGFSVLDPDEPANNLVAMGMRARPLCCLALVERVLQLAYKTSPLLMTQKTRVNFEVRRSPRCALTFFVLWLVAFRITVQCCSKR